MGCETAPAEPRLEQLDPADRSPAVHPIAARSFKTLARRRAYARVHAPSLLCSTAAKAMTLEHALAVLAFSVAAAGTPGPSNALLTATGAHVGVVRGLAALFGVATGMGLMIFAVAFGLGAVILSNSGLLLAVKWVGAAVLCWFAWNIATSPSGSIASQARPVGFLGAAAFQWINPKSWLVSASAAATFLTPGGGPTQFQAAELAVLFVIAALPSCLAWLAFGALLQHVLRSAATRRTFNIAMGLLLAASVVLLIT
jgi:threonine/homoserine/homoserine lactone efflux protein